MQVAVVGGGAAGFFLAIILKTISPQTHVVILERQQRVLAKVAVSGGGRCNCTNTFRDVVDLQHVYPRGHRLIKRLFNTFGPADAQRWFQDHGVPLAIQPDQCIFPASQDSQTIIDCLLSTARRLGVELRLGVRIDSLDDLEHFDAVAIATGGAPQQRMLDWLHLDPSDFEAPVPSLFSLSIDNANLNQLMGVVVPNASVSIASTNFKAQGALLLTHWGVSGPAILKLSSYAARHLAQQDYKVQLCINWLSGTEEAARNTLDRMAKENKLKLLSNTHPQSLTQRLWNHILLRAQLAEPKPGSDGSDVLCTRRWTDVGKKDINRLVSTLTADTYATIGRAPFRDEFVTCGGLKLKMVDPNTLQHKKHPNLFFAGEVLDIDGITGGFNFQAAWTTGFVAAHGVAKFIEGLCKS